MMHNVRQNDRVFMRTHHVSPIDSIHLDPEHEIRQHPSLFPTVPSPGRGMPVMNNTHTTRDLR